MNIILEDEAADGENVHYLLVDLKTVDMED